jgi:hypothetical protein
MKQNQSENPINRSLKKVTGYKFSRINQSHINHHREKHVMKREEINRMYTEEMTYREQHIFRLTHRQGCVSYYRVTISSL